MRIKKKKQGIFKKIDEMLKDSLDYLSESKKYIWFVVGAFLLSGFFGFFCSAKLGFLDEVLRKIAEKAVGLGAFDLILFIFNNNIGSAFFSLIFGVFLGVFPLISTISNGIILGYVLKKVWEVSAFTNFWRILPHGIFELPALFISLALGVKLGMFVFSKDMKKEFVYRLYNSLKVFVFIVVPLLVIAAIIEGLLIALL